jgi:hypothetical protein
MNICANGIVFATILVLLHIMASTLFFCFLHPKFLTTPSVMLNIIQQYLIVRPHFSKMYLHLFVYACDCFASNGWLVTLQEALGT